MQFIDLIKQQSFIFEKLENRIRNVLNHGKYIKAKSNQHRNFVLNELKDRNIPVAVYYRIPLHLQKVFQNPGYQKGDFPVAKKTADDFFGKFVEIVSDGDVDPASEVTEAERDGKLADSGDVQTISEGGGLSPMVWGVGIVAIVAILLIIFGN